MASGISYTSATGKQPNSWVDNSGDTIYEWCHAEDEEDTWGNPIPDSCRLPDAIHERLRAWDENDDCWWAFSNFFPTEDDAKAAADKACERAIADGAMRDTYEPADS